MKVFINSFNVLSGHYHKRTLYGVYTPNYKSDDLYALYQYNVRSFSEERKIERDEYWW